MRIKDLVPGRKILSTRENLEQTAGMIKEHYRMQLRGFISEMQVNKWGISIYSEVTVDSLWNHTALFWDTKSRLPGNLEAVKAFALNHRRYPNVYIVAEAPDADEILTVLRKTNYEVLHVESWMVFRERYLPPEPPLGAIEIKKVETGAELTDFVKVFNDSYSSSHVYMGDAVKSQFYSPASREVKHFIGYVAGHPVCIATLIMGREGRACIYNVGTAVNYRRKGYGAIITSHLIKESVKAGLTTLFLQVDYRGGAERIYKKLGFEELFHRISLIQGGISLPEHEAESFWRSWLDGIEVGTKLPQEGISPEESIPSGETRPVEYKKIPAVLGIAFENFLSKCGLTVDTLLTGAWSLLLSRYCNTEIVLFGELDKFIFPMPVHIDHLSDLISWLRSIAEIKNKIKQYGHIPLLEIQGWSNITGEDRLFSTVLELTPGTKPGSAEMMYRIYPLVCKFIRQEKVFEINYNRGFFTQSTIQRMLMHLLHLVEGILKNPDLSPASLEIVTEDERHEILYDFNDTKTGYPRHKTLHQLFAEQAAHTPDRTAVVGPAAATGNGVSKKMQRDQVFISYMELNQKANRLAGLLTDKVAEPGAIIGLMLERSVELILGVLTILKAGGAYLPINPDFPGARKKYLVKDSGASLLLTSQSLSREVEKLRSLNVETVFLDGPGIRQETSKDLSNYQPPGFSNLAYVIYTSGTTGRPKGVLVEHCSAVNVVTWFAGQYKLKPGFKVLQMSDFTFDASVNQIFGTLLHGAELHVISKDLLLNIEALRKYIEYNGINLINFVPLLLKELLAVGDKLASLKAVISGAEKLEDITREQILKKGYRLYNQYGPTEATIDALSAACSDKTVSLGKPIANTRCYILDKNHHLVPVGAVGELYIAGTGIARGYLNRPELSAEKFITTKHNLSGTASLFVRSKSDYEELNETRLYSTGDLTGWLPGGDIKFLGRIDQQVKIRGFRIELEEIKNCLLEHELVKEAVVIARGDENKEKKLYAYIVEEPIRGQPEGRQEVNDIFEFRDYLSRTLPDYMIPAYFIKIEKIPLTPGGKVAVKDLPVPEASGAKEYTAPRDRVEKKLTRIWTDVLKITPDVGDVGIDDNFFELGGHSLKGTLIIARIYKEFNVRMPLQEIFRLLTIRKLAQYIKDAVKVRYIPIEPSALKDYYPLSSAQTRLFILNQIEFESTIYNISSFFIFAETPGRKRLADAFNKLIARHESFRTSFHLLGQEPVQKIHDPGEIQFEIEDFEAFNRQEIINNRVKARRAVPGEKETGMKDRCALGEPGSAVPERFIRPFDLSKAPLLRAGLVDLGDDRDILMVDMHHIISDGTSLEIFKRELVDLYESKQLPALRLQYKDYALWQNRESKTEKLKAQQDYWLHVFAGEIPVLNLPIDYPRPKVQSFAGKTLFFELSGDVANTLKKLAQGENVTLFMILVAALNILLAKLSGQEDIVLGSPSAGRGHPDIERTIGMFVNTLSLRNFPSGDKIFAEFLQEIKACTINAFENQDFQFEDLVELLNVDRDAGRNPLFDVMFVLQNIEDEKVENHGLSLKNYQYESNISKFDMTLITKETVKDLSFKLEYCSKLFAEDTILRFIYCFRNIISAIIKNPGQRVADIEIISEEEKRNILFNFNDTSTRYPNDKLVNGIFREQAAKTPGYIAVVGQGAVIEHSTARRDVSLTYLKLSRESDRLAAVLVEKGIRAGSIVGIMINPSIEMIVGIFAVLKAGGAYLPIDPEYPGDRKNYILKDSSAQVLITTQELFAEVAEFKNLELDRIFIEELEKFRSLEVEEDFERDILRSSLTLNSSTHQPINSSTSQLLNFSTSKLLNSLKNPAYIIYTSGSTGKPKGVVVEHYSVVNILFSLQDAFPMSAKDSYLLKTSFMFDVSVAELFGWFFGGSRLVIMGQDERKEPQKIIDLIESAGITHINFVPSLFNAFLELLDVRSISKLVTLRYIFLAGEALPPLLVKKFRSLASKVILENIYGPTEGTVYSSRYSLLNWDGTGNIPIGKPLPNMKLYIRSKEGRLQPIGVPGELTITGAGVARGYLNNPGLTNEKFLADPLSEGDRVYRTGDLTRWLPDGNIAFFGRLDHQVKIRGFRVELGEIQHRLLEYDGIKEAVVTLNSDEKGDSYLCAYIVTRSKEHGTANEEGRLRESLSQKLPSYMIPSFFVYLDKIPLTAGGKIDRKSLPRPEVGGGVGYRAPGNQIEGKLVDIWSAALGIEKGKIGIDDNFFALGGHSLKGIAVMAAIHKEFDVRLTLSEIFEMPVIRRLAEYIKGSVEDLYLSIAAAEKKDYYILSSAQKRLYILDQVEIESKSYNMPTVFEIIGEPDRKRLEEAFRKLIIRQESFRTSFHMMGREPVQKAHDPGEIQFEIENSVGARRALGEPESFILERFVRPFDLSKAPLLRVGLVETGAGRLFLMVDMHHIISDATSMAIFRQELVDLYESKVLPGLRIQYKDYTEWQKRESKTEKIKAQQDYWLNDFAGEIPVLNLPIDYHRPKVQSFAGKTLFFSLTGEAADALKKLAKDENVTLFMMLAAVLIILLAKLSDQEDIVLGSPAAGRSYHDLEGMFGMFVNTLVLRSYPEGEKRFGEFLQEIKNITLSAYENQEYQFEELVEQLNVQRDAGRNPLFDVMFVYQEKKTGKEGMRTLELRPYRYDIKIAKFDLTLVAEELEDKFIFSLVYSTKLFKEETVNRFIEFFNRIVSSILKKPVGKISEIVIVSESEKKEILYNFNNTETDYPKNVTISQLFVQQAAIKPDNIAVVSRAAAAGTLFPAGPGISLSYRELNRKSCRLAALLIGKGVGLNTIVGIMSERSPGMIIGVLAILKAGGAYLPISPAYPDVRKRYMLADSNAAVLLTDHSKVEEVEKFRSLEVENLLIEEYSGDPYVRPSNLKPVTSSSNLAYVIYTSGSTGEPKGAMVNHYNVVRLVKNTNYIEFRPGDRILPTGALEFDASTFEIWGALLNGLGLYLESDDVILSPAGLKETIQRNKITTMWLTSPLFNQLVQEEIEIFRGLKNFLVGGDVLSPPHINKLRERFPELNIINGYGPTENTTFSATYLIDKEYKINIPIGRPIANSTAYIVDKSSNLQPIGVAGELILGGDGVCRGYLNNPELTAEKFVKAQAASFKPQAQAKDVFLTHQLSTHQLINLSTHQLTNSSTHSLVYRTGDLARWLPDGNIDFLGRMDYQVKVRGYRIELEEIESRLLERNDIKEAVVLLREKDEDKYLCAYLVRAQAAEPTGETPESTELREYLSRTLPDYMVPSFLVFIEKMPLTPNGKVDRKSLPEPEKIAAVAYSPPRDGIEEKLVAIWAKTLGLGERRIGIDDNFFEIGGHSLKGTILTTKIHKEFNARISLAEIFKFPTVRKLSRCIKEAVKDKYLSIEPAKEKDYYLLSSAQKRLYILDQVEYGSINYNIPMVYEIDEKPGKERLETVFKELMARHESFRTSFHMVGEEPVQVIHETFNFEIEHYDLTKTSSGEGPSPKTSVETTILSEPAACSPQPVTSTIERFIRPFDLSKAPLLRVGLIEKDGKNLLMVDMHHIISDGTSVEIFKRELAIFYESKQLPALRIQYKDYAEWQNRAERREIIKAQEEFWLQQFADEIPVLNLPMDYPRPAVQSFAGNTISFELGIEETKALKKLAKEENVTLFMVLTAICNILFGKLSGQEDIVLGIPAAGRNHPDLENIIGMFVNTLPLRGYPGVEKRFKKFLQEIKHCTLSAFENQDYQFEDLVELLHVNRDAGRNPLFDIMFALQDIDSRAMGQEAGALKLRSYKYDYNIAKFDLTLIVEESGETLSFYLQYCTKLFKQETINRYMNYFGKIVTTVSESPAEKISGIEMISNKEKGEILYHFNDRESGYPNNRTICQLFAEQTGRTPDNTAVVGLVFGANVGAKHSKHRQNGKASSLQVHITYRELDNEAGTLANVLIAKGLRTGDIAGILVERSIEMILGIIAILKTGGAYLPINPRNPAERNRYMLDDCSVKVLLAGRGLNEEVKKLRSLEVETVFVDEVGPGVGARHAVPSDPAACNLRPVTSPLNLAYVIYTSGSTGVPKGVPVSHANFCPLIHWGYRHLRLDAHDKVVQNLSYYFDWSVWEIFIALTTGASLYIPSEEVLLDTEAYVDFIRERKITVLHITPSQFQSLISTGQEPVKLETLKYLCIGAEKLSYELVKRSFRVVDKDCRVFNMYGPTEASIISSVLEIEKADEKKIERLSGVPIGIPVANAALLVLDKGLKMCPVKVTGELVIAGDGLAGGYLNNPELTAEKFVSFASGGQLFEKSWTKIFIKPLRSGTQNSSFSIHRSALLYKTGDLVRWLPNGSLEFLGRIDYQVKIRGFRIELGEIEKQLLKHDGIKAVVVTLKEEAEGSPGGNDDKYLCAYIAAQSAEPGAQSAEPVGANLVFPRDAALPDLREYLSQTLPGYMIPTHFIAIDKIPLNPNGKVDLKALPAPGAVGIEREYIAPRDEIEEKLVEIWSNVLNITSELGIDDNFFELGGHSLKGTVLIAKIHKEFNARISLAEIFKLPTIRKLARYIKEAVKDKYISIEPVEEKSHYNLSFNQERLWFIYQREPQSPAFNMPGIIELPHHLDRGALKRAMAELIRRHESLRTGFKIVADEPVQFILPRVEELPLREIDISHLGEARREQEWERIFKDESHRVFDLTWAPLFRYILVKQNERNFKLIFTMHHTIFDGWSMEIFKKELVYLYENYRAGESIKLAPLKQRYKDFSEWQSRQAAKGAGSGEAHRFWRKKVEQGVPRVALPMSISGDSRDLSGAMYRFWIPAELKEGLKKLGDTHHTTLFMVMFTIYIIALSRFSNQEDIACSIISAGREHEALHPIIGFFVNSILFKTRVKKKEVFDKLLQRVHAEVLESFKYQDYPLERVFQEMRMRYPDIPIAFNMVNIQVAAGDSGTGAGNMETYKSHHTTDTRDVKFDLEPYIIEYGNGIDTLWVYRKSLFNVTTVEYFVRDYIKLMEFFTAHPDKSYEDFKASGKKKKITLIS